MHRAAFQLNKVRRLIKTQGQVFTIEIHEKNNFGEPTGKPKLCEILGVFHETTGYMSKTTSEASTLRKKPSPMVLTLWESIGELQHTNLIKFNDKSYRVTEIKNLGEANLIADISLEEVQT